MEKKFVGDRPEVMRLPTLFVTNLNDIGLKGKIVKF